jgi:hypothetical protein
MPAWWNGIHGGLKNLCRKACEFESRGGYMDNDLEQRAEENRLGRIDDGVGVEDSFSLDMHIARVISVGLEYFPESQITEEIQELQEIFRDYSENGHRLGDSNIERGLDLLKENFRGLWW